VGYDPSDIIVAGNPVRGNLALIRVISSRTGKGSGEADLSALLTPPGTLLLISLWTDLSNSHPDTHMVLIPPGGNCGLGASAYTDDMDITDESLVDRRYFPSYRSIAFVGPFGLGAALHNSPASLSLFVQARFMRFPCLLIVSQGTEKFLDQILTLRERMTGKGQGHIIKRAMVDKSLFSLTLTAPCWTQRDPGLVSRLTLGDFFFLWVVDMSNLLIVEQRLVSLTNDNCSMTMAK